MAMAVDAARQHQLGRRVDLARPRPEAAAERRDDAVLDPDIALRRIGGGRHRAVADHQIEFGHVVLAKIAGGSRGGDLPHRTRARKDHRGAFAWPSRSRKAS